MFSIDVCTGYSQVKAILLIQPVTSFNTCAALFFNLNHKISTFHSVLPLAKVRAEKLIYMILSIFGRMALLNTKKYFKEC